MWRGRPRPRNGKMSKTRRSRRIFTWCGNGEANEPDGERQPQRQERSAPKGQHNLAQDVSPRYSQKKTQAPPRRNTIQDLHAPRRHPPGRDEALPPHRKGCPPFSHPVRKSALLLPSSHQPHRIHIHNHLRPRNLLLRRIDEHRS
jgi:hypothetical protein